MFDPKPEHKFTFDLWTVGSIVGRGLQYERLDQLTVEILTGVR